MFGTPKKGALLSKRPELVLHTSLLDNQRERGEVLHTAGGADYQDGVGTCRSGVSWLNRLGCVTAGAAPDPEDHARKQNGQEEDKSCALSSLSDAEHEHAE